MKLNALLMCREHESLSILAMALEELEIDQEACVSTPNAMELLALGHYSALLVDFDLPGAAQLVHMARLAPAQRRPVVFAVIDAHIDVGSTFQAGANFVLYKPLVREQVLRSLHAGRVFMKPDRRQSPRHKTDALVYLKFGDVCVRSRLWCSISAKTAWPYKPPSRCLPPSYLSASFCPARPTRSKAAVKWPGRMILATPAFSSTN
jgi:CheY-like chemotaxis protein